MQRIFVLTPHIIDLDAEALARLQATRLRDVTAEEKLLDKGICSLGDTVGEHDDYVTLLKAAFPCEHLRLLVYANGKGGSSYLQYAAPVTDKCGGSTRLYHSKTTVVKVNTQSI